MFNPTRDQVRQFFFDAWAKHRQGDLMVGLEAIVLDIALAHPEYHVVLDQPDRFRQQDWTPDQGQTNPFLHLSMHLAIEEQRSIDQPPGIRNALTQLTVKLADPHAATHAAMECLGEMIWQAQRSGGAPDASTYVECVQRRAR